MRPGLRLSAPSAGGLEVVPVGDKIMPTKSFHVLQLKISRVATKTQHGQIHKLKNIFLKEVNLAISKL